MCYVATMTTMLSLSLSLSLHLEDTIVANSPIISIDVTTTSYICITTLSLLFHEPPQQSWASNYLRARVSNQGEMISFVSICYYICICVCVCVQKNAIQRTSDLIYLKL